jgi:hypothetical protein
VLPLSSLLLPEWPGVAGAVEAGLVEWFNGVSDCTAAVFTESSLLESWCPNIVPPKLPYGN